MRHRLSGYILLELLLCMNSSPKKYTFSQHVPSAKTAAGQNAALKVCAWPVCTVKIEVLPFSAAAGALNAVCIATTYEGRGASRSNAAFHKNWIKLW